jgi:hypothetical protein
MSPLLSRRIPVSILLVLALVVVIHADYHIARPHHMRLSLALDAHWLLALPIFALVAWLVRRIWQDRLWPASAWNLGLAALGAQIVEPLIESLVYLRRVSVPLEPERWQAFVELMTAGLLTYIIVMAMMEKRDSAVG